MFTCPVCFYDNLPYPPEDYNICPSCGTEFGNDDEFRSHAELRNRWLADGAKWFFREAPVGWDPIQQLLRANLVNVADLTVETIATSAEETTGSHLMPLYRLDIASFVSRAVSNEPSDWALYGELLKKAETHYEILDIATTESAWSVYGAHLRDWLVRPASSSYHFADETQYFTVLPAPVSATLTSAHDVNQRQRELQAFAS